MFNLSKSNHTKCNCSITITNSGQIVRNPKMHCDAFCISLLHRSLGAIFIFPVRKQCSNVLSSTDESSLSLFLHTLITLQFVFALKILYIAYILIRPHSVTDIKLNSPAHISGKIEDGDEIIQIEYQTVVGWHYKKVLLQLQDSPSDVIVTLKKRPKHSKIYGQIYMKPYRLPSKKKTIPSRWGAADEVHTSPPALARPQLIAANSINTNHNNHQTNNLSPVDQPSGVVSAVRVDSPDKQQRQSLDWDEGSDIATPTESKPTDFLLESRAIVQRRHTICADRGYCGYKSQMLSWHKFRHGTAIAESPSLRDKSVSFGFGLDTTPRPTTHTGMPNHTRSHDIKGSLPAIRGGDQSSGSGSEVDENSETTSIETRCAKPGVSKVVRFETSKEMESQFKDNEYTCKVDQTVLEVFEPIPYADDEDVALTSNVRSESGSVCAEESAQAVNEVLVRREIARWEQKVAASAYVPETKKVASVAKGVNVSGKYF